MNDFAIKRVEELSLKEFVKPKCHVLDTVEFSDIVARVKCGEIERVVFYVRHSERPEIDVNDPTFGANLGLTDYGVKLAHEVGTALRGIPNLVAYASPARRTILTAQEILLSYGVTNPIVMESDEISLNGLYTEDGAVLHESYRTRGSGVVNDAYNNGEFVAGYISRDKASRAMYNYLTGPELEGNLLMVSHDVFIAAFMMAISEDKFGFSTKRWIGFIQGAALTLEADGWHIYYVVPNIASHHSVFIQ
jgi:broad specificity phosphatase PhoE